MVIGTVTMGVMLLVACAHPVASDHDASTVVLKATILADGPEIADKLSWTMTPVTGGDAVFRATNAGRVEATVAPGKYRVTVVWSGWHDDKAKHGDAVVRVDPQAAHEFTVPIDLELPVILDAVAETGEGQAFDVRWSGPDDIGATISVSRPEDAAGEAIASYSALKARRNFERSAGRLADGIATTQMPAPPVAGDYEIRYTLKLPTVILARRPLRVTDSRYTLSAPAEATVSSPIKVEWSGTLTAGDFVTLVPKGHENIFDSDRYDELMPGQPATLTTPAVPGDYEIRYIMNASYSKQKAMRRTVQASTPIRVIDISAAVTGPETAIGGSTIEVSWRAPAAGWHDDVLSIVARGSTAFNRDSWAKIAVDGAAANPASIRVPAVAGDYDIVYVLVPGERIIARTPLSVSLAQASVDAPARVVAGQDFSVQYTGDAFQGDRIVVVRANYPDDKMWGVTTGFGFAAAPAGRTGIVPGSAISEPGDYEVRYVTGLQHQVLARDAFTVSD